MPAVDKFAPALRDLRICKEQIEKIEKLLLMMQDNEILFSPEEMEQVQRVADAERSREQQLVAELEARMRIYEEHVVQAREVLSERLRLLNVFDKDTGLLGERDDIMKTLVEGQTKMETQIRQIEERLFVTKSSAPSLTSERYPTPESKRKPV
jgi:hypothetical protein